VSEKEAVACHAGGRHGCCSIRVRGLRGRTCASRLN
jgi:hypothetical protein